MIKSFRHKGLKELFETGHTTRIDERFHKRLKVRLDAMRYAVKLEQLAQPGFDFHQLMGKPVRYTIHVNGPWCITFEWDEPYAEKADFEQYH